MKDKWKKVEELKQEIAEQEKLFDARQKENAPRTTCSGKVYVRTEAQLAADKRQWLSAQKARVKDLTRRTSFDPFDRVLNRIERESKENDYE
jgi:hypothetical protein